MFDREVRIIEATGGWVVTLHVAPGVYRHYSIGDWAQLTWLVNQWKLGQTPESLPVYDDEKDGS